MVSDRQGVGDPFEPKAQSILNAIGRGDAPKGVKCEDAYAVSIAVSLKRIADSLEALTITGIAHPQSDSNHEDSHDR